MKGAALRKELHRCPTKKLFCKYLNSLSVSVARIFG